MQRSTELRHLSPDLRNKITTYLEENNCWKILMSVVPKNVNCFDDKKYTNEQINLIATPRQGDSRLSAEIFLEEWATSGKKEQRPTLGTLLQLLVDAKLYGIADYVAEILNEPPPQRPQIGPGARIDIEMPSTILNGVASYVNDSSFYPNTEDIKAIIENGISEMNQDFYTKYRQNDKSIGLFEVAPKPAPRSYRKSERLQKQEQERHLYSSTKEQNHFPCTTTTIVNGSSLDAHQTEFSENATPNATLNSLQPANGIVESTESKSAPPLPLVSMLLSDTKIEKTSSKAISNTIASCAPLPLLSAFHPDDAVSNTDRLPAISALNLGGQPDDNCLEKTQDNETFNGDYDEDESNCIDEDEDSLRNLEGSNNDSSLTNVTGTSGDNSFELSSSSTSNENIPLNVLNFSR